MSVVVAPRLETERLILRPHWQLLGFGDIES
jgi:hypothetical protein